MGSEMCIRDRCNGERAAGGGKLAKYAYYAYYPLILALMALWVRLYQAP